MFESLDSSEHFRPVIPLWHETLFSDTAGTDSHLRLLGRAVRRLRWQVTVEHLHVDHSWPV